MNSSKNEHSSPGKPLILDQIAHTIWQTLAEAGSLEIADLVERTGLHQSEVTGATTFATEAGYMTLDERQREELIVSPNAATILQRGLPERLAMAQVDAAGGEFAVADLTSWAKDRDIPANEIFRWGGARGWLRRVKDDQGVRLVLTDEGKAALKDDVGDGGDVGDDDERALRRALADKGRIFLDELAKAGLDASRIRKLLGKRPELAKIRKPQPTCRRPDRCRAVGSGHGYSEARAERPLIRRSALGSVARDHFAAL